MKINFAHLCDYAMLSREGKLSVMGIFTGLRPPKLPYAHPQFFLAFQMEFSYAEAGRPVKVEIHAVDADGNRLLTLGNEFTIQSKTGQFKPGDRPQSGQVIAIHGLQFTRAGRHDFNIFLNGNLAHTLEFEVAPRPQPPLNLTGGTPPATP